jgi:hypothetical protein
MHCSVNLALGCKGRDDEEHLRGKVRTTPLLICRRGNWEEIGRSLKAAAANVHCIDLMNQKL